MNDLSEITPWFQRNTPKMKLVFLLLAVLSGVHSTAPEKRDLLHRVSEKPVISPEKTVVAPQKPVVLLDKPLVTSETPILVHEKPLVIPEKLAVVPIKPVVVPEKPVALPEKPLVKAEKPVVALDKPVVLAKPPSVAPVVPLVVGEPAAVVPEVPLVVVKPPAPIPAVAACNIQGANSRKARVVAENFCNEPNAKSTGSALLLRFAGKWSWTYVPALAKCRRHQLKVNGTSQVFLDVHGDPELVYVNVKGVIFRDSPPKWHCASVSTNFFALDSSPDHNVILQVECVTSGYEFSVNIQDYTKVNEANRNELVSKYGFDLSNMDLACALLSAPVA